MRKIVGILVATFALAFCFTSCMNDTPVSPEENKEWSEYTVAVVLPSERGLSEHWERTLESFTSNFQSAFRNQKKGVRLRFEFYDESTDNLDEIALRLATREDIYAVIGGLYSGNALTLASRICINEKALFTLATTEELVRAYSSTGWLWAMTETDITQTEMLLTKVINYGGKSVALFAREDDLYSKTFIDWYAFQAKELGLENKGLYDYNPGNLKQRAEAAMASGADYLLCAPPRIEDISVILTAHDEYRHTGNEVPKLMFSDTGYGADVIALLGERAEGLEGVTFGADPESEFDVTYQTQFGENPSCGEAQLYDAAMLIGYAAWYQLLHPETDFMNAMREIVTGTDTNTGSWTGDGMTRVVDALSRGGSPAIRGASGEMTFDSEVFTNILNTTYYHYKVHGGQYVILDYNISDGTNRTDATLAGWNWKATQTQDFENSGGLNYPPHRGNKALLVASSKGWQNYRHQADVLAIYQLLKQYGYDDDSIILIAEDDLAFNSSNLDPGIVRITPEGANVHADIKIDYRMSQLMPEDILRILRGEKNGRLPVVIDSNENDNLFIFWSGHGVPGALCWNDMENAITGSMLAAAFSQMKAAHSYRKLLMMVEACYSGSVMEQCSGIPGMLFITAANGDETSKSDVYSEYLKVWMSNRFTSTFIREIASERDTTLLDLYYRLFLNTVGSHVMVYNHDNFSNLYTTSMSEFLTLKE